jgi:hypothetical protein
MAVYMIQSGVSGQVKIGVTNNPASRLRGLQTANAAKLHLIRVLDGGQDVETSLHARFSSLRTFGEWFTFAPEMLADDMGFADLPIPVAERGHKMGIGSIIQTLGGPKRVAATLGLRASQVSNWTMRDAIPPEHHIVVWRMTTAANIVWTPPHMAGFILASVCPSASAAVKPTTHASIRGSQAA